MVLWLATSGDHSRFDYQVAHIIGGGSEHLAEGFRAADIPLRSLSALNHYDLRWAVRLRRLILSEKIDVLHLHLPYVAFVGRLVVSTIPKRRRPVIVYTEHNVFPQYKPVIRALHRLSQVMDQADVAVSNAVKRSLPPAMRARTEVVVHGLPAGHGGEQSDRDAIRDDFGVGMDQVMALTVANLRPEKGYEVLLEAASRVAEAGLRVKFVAVGRGPLEAELREAVVLRHLSDSFIFAGFRSDARQIMAASDLFILPSHFEGNPVAVMEALVEGLPIISTEVGDVPEVIGTSGAGVVVPRNDPAALAEAIGSLVQDPGRRAQMRASALAAGEQFDIKRAVERLEEIYEAALA